MSLRTDERSWMIYDEESIGAVVRMMEAYAMSVTGQKLRRRPEIQLRAMGEMMIRLGEQRGWEASREDGVNKEAMEHFSIIGAYLAGQTVDPVRLTTALDEIHAAVFRLDQKARSAGMQGPGRIKELVRGD